jgi:hypothetical protein
MATDMVINQPLQIEYEYDFAIEGGVDDTLVLLSSATRNPGLLPLGFAVTGSVITVTTAVVGSSSTIIAGTTDDPNGFIAAVAEADLAAFDTAGSAGSIATAQPVANDAASRDVTITIGTANLTAGKFKLTIFGFIATDKAGAA